MLIIIEMVGSPTASTSRAWCCAEKDRDWRLEICNKCAPPWRDASGVGKVVHECIVFGKRYVENRAMDANQDKCERFPLL